MNLTQDLRQTTPDNSFRTYDPKTNSVKLFHRKKATYLTAFKSNFKINGQEPEAEANTFKDTSVLERAKTPDLCRKSKLDGLVSSEFIQQLEQGRQNNKDLTRSKSALDYSYNLKNL